MDLVARIQAGDVDAFETLYRQHSARIYTLACRMAGSAEDGEDLLQEIFLQAYRKLGSFKGDSALGTWLYRLALNHCLDFVRSRQAKMNKLTETLDAEASFEPTARRETPIARIDLERARRAAAGRLPRGVRAARRRRIRPQGGRRAARHRGRHVEVAGVQGAAEAARVAAREAAVDTCIRTTRPSTTTSTARSARPSAPSVEQHLATCAACRQTRRRSARDPARGRRRSSCASRRCAPGRGSSARSGWSAHARDRRGSAGRAASTRWRPRGRDAERSRWLAGSPRRRRSCSPRWSACGTCRPARRRRDRRAGAPARRSPPAKRRSRSRPSCGRPRRTTRTRSRGSTDRQQRAERARSADRGDAAEEPRGHRSGDQREPRGGARAAGERAGAAEPDRGLQDQDRAAAGHRGAHQRNAQRQRGRRGADRRPGSNKKAPDMRLTCAVRDSPGSPSRPRPAAGRRTSGHRIVRAATWSRDASGPAPYQGRNNGPEQTERFSRKVKIGRDGRVQPLQHLRRHRRHRRIGRRGVDRSRQADARRQERAGARADHRRRARRPRRRPDRARTEPARPERPGDHVSVDYTVTVPASASVDVHSVSGTVKVTGVHGSRARRDGQRRRHDHRYAEARSRQDACPATSR